MFVIALASAGVGMSEKLLKVREKEIESEIFVCINTENERECVSFRWEISGDKFIASLKP